MNMNITPLYKDKPRYINCDISEIIELQEDYREMAIWLKEAWWITPNEKRIMLRFDAINDEAFNLPLIPSGLVMLSDISAVAPLPVVTRNGN